MAFPSTRSASAGTQNTNSTSWTLTYPGAGDILDGGSTAIEAGDLILINIGRDGTAGTGSISGYSSLFDQASGANRGQTFAKVADGTETGTFSYSPGASEQGAWRIAVIKNWWGTIASGVAVSATATGTSANPDPGSLTPSWGAADTYWRAVCAFDDGRRSISAYPSSPDNFNLLQNSDSSGGSGGAGMGSAGLDKNAASVDPGTFTITASVGWVAWLIAIRPTAPTYVYRGNQAWSGRYKGSRSDAAIYLGTRTLHT